MAHMAYRSYRHLTLSEALGSLILPYLKALLGRGSEGPREYVRVSIHGPHGLWFWVSSC